MEFTDFIPLPLTKNICRTCLVEIDTNLVGLQDLIAFELNSIKIIDMLTFLGFVGVSIIFIKIVIVSLLIKAKQK